MTQITRTHSIRQVAEAAGVSVATVSRVLNTPNQVRADTAERVREAVRRLQYRPNPFAKGLTTRRSMLLGLSVPEMHGEYYSSLVTAADRAARGRGYHLLVTSHLHPGAEPSEDPRVGFALDMLDGLLLMVTDPDKDAANIAGAADLPVPVVLLGHPGRAAGAPSIAVDNAVGTRQAAEHLLEGTPPEKCWFVGGPRTNSDTQSRRSAFFDVLRNAGHEPRDEQAVFGSYSTETGVRWARSMHERGLLDGSGVLAANDEIAIGVVNEARDRGLNVPRDLRVIGFDDTSLCGLVRPTLSSVRIPKEEMAGRAVELLVGLLQNEEVELSAPLVTELVQRESSSTPRRGRSGGRK